MKKKDVERFWSKVLQHSPDACWTWLGWHTTAGYGMFGIDYKDVGAHRIAYQLCKGPIPTGASICHHCDNPGCVNPAHLFAGTQRDNMQDKVKKGRMRGHFKRGARHPNSRLDAARIRQIRRALQSKEETQRDLAKRFGVSEQTICDIVKGRRWGWVSNAGARWTTS